MVTSAALGVPAMAAMSLKHRPSALWPIFSARSLGREMNALHYRIGLEQQQAVGQPDVQHGAIVTGADDHRGVGRQRAGEAADQLEFVHRPQRSWSRRRPKFSALNSAWAVMGASRLLVRS